MKADYQISRSDAEADRADEARAEWISERANALEVLYSADEAKVGSAVADFFLAEDETLVPNLTMFLLRYGDAPNGSAYILSAQLRQAIAPILREYAEDAATDEWNRMEARELDIAAERRAAA